MKLQHSIHQFTRQGRWAIVVVGVLVMGISTGLGVEMLPDHSTNGVSGPAQLFTDEQICEAWGGLIAHDKKLAGIEITSDELTVFMRGFEQGIQGQSLLSAPPEVIADVEKLAKARRYKLVQAIADKNEAAATKTFRELKTRTNIIELPTGVLCELIRPGTGASPKLQQTVNVHYTGRLLDGTEFVQMGPMDLVLTTNHGVCRDWTEALKILKPGGALTLYVPPPLPDGDDERLGVPPGSALVYEVELLDFKDTAPADLEAALLPPAPASSLPSSGLNEAQLFEAWGRGISSSMGLAQLHLNEPLGSALKQGLATGIKGDQTDSKLAAQYPAVRTFVSEKRRQARLARRELQQKSMRDFFSKLGENKNVTRLPDGLCYEIIKLGTGAFPKPGQIVVVDYIGHLLDGKVFDKTYNEPLHIEIGSVLPGLNEGLQKINSGGEIKLYIPPALGYGDEDASSVVSSVPADSVLIYELQLLEIQSPTAVTTGNNSAPK